MSHTHTAEADAHGGSRWNDGGVVFVPALLIALAGFVSSFLAYYPGAMTWDSFVMFGMGREWPWHDWHSPYIALLMGASRRLTGDPSGLLFVQLLLSWSGLYFAACGLRRQAPVWAALLPLLGFTPMFLVVSGYLHKTPLQASVFLFVFGVLYWHHRRRRSLGTPCMMLLVLLLLLGIPLREYGLVCALPLGAFLAWCRSRRTGVRALAGYLIAATALSGASLAIHHLVVYRVLEARKLYKAQSLYRYDLAAIYALSGVDFAPRLIRERYRSHGSMRDLYEREKGMWRIMYAYEGGIPTGHSVPKDIPERALTQEEMRYYQAAWLEALGQHPGTWLRHKMHGFATSVGLGVEVDGFRRAHYYRSRQNIYGLRQRGGPLYRLLNRYMKRVRGSLLLKPWLWLLITVCLLVLGSLAYRQRPLYRGGLTPILVLLVSASLLYPQLFVTALDGDVRFSYWAIIACALSLHLFLATFLSPAPEGEQSPLGEGERQGTLRPPRIGEPPAGGRSVAHIRAEMP